MMNVSVGFYHPRLGYYALDFIPIDQVETWLLSIDCDMLGSDVFNFEGELIPIGELTPIVLHLHALDKAFNRMAGFKGRCANFMVKMPRQ